MLNKIKILFVEDSQDDLELLTLNIESRGVEVDWNRVEREDDLLNDLEKNVYDVIICDYVIPGYSGIDAVRTVRKKYPYYPIIIASGTIGEDLAVDALQAGADDYIMKSNLMRLVPAIERAINEKANEKELFQKTQDLELINELNFAANKGASILFLSEILNEKVKEVFNATAATVYLLDSEKKTLTIYKSNLNKSLVNEMESFLGRKIEDEIEIPLFEGSFFNKILKAKKPILLNDKETILRLFDSYSNSKEYERYAQGIKEKSGINEMIATPILFNNDVLGIINISTQGEFTGKDLKRITTIQNELSSIIKRKLLEKELKEQKEIAVESNRLKNAFLANMSHEIRTPLNAIIGFTELLLKPGLKDKDRKTFQRFIKYNGEGLIRIIENIIDVSKLQINQMRLHKSSVDINKIAKELVVNYQQYIDEQLKKKIKIICDNDNLEEEFELLTDKNRIKQVLEHLLSNSIKYTEEGQINFGFSVDEEKIHFYVTDTGIGIPKKFLSNIFNSFEQHADSYKKFYEGTGLGLAITKGIIDLMEGEIVVKSIENKGSTFEFWIPFLQETKKQVRNDINSDDSDWSDKSILVVDDEEANFVLTKRMLKKHKPNLVWVKNGKEAVDYVKTHETDLILMDIKMPVMDGYEATSIIKKFNPKIPVFAQTAYALSTEREKSIKVGCDEYFSKPIDLDAFLIKIEAYLNKKRKE